MTPTATMLEMNSSTSIKTTNLPFTEDKGGKGQRWGKNPRVRKQHHVPAV